MFTPERMRRVVIVAAKPRMRSVVDALHASQLLHVQDYTSDDVGFDLGQPFPEGSKLAENLLKVKGWQKSLEIEGAEAPAASTVRDPEAELRALEADLGKTVEERGKAMEQRKELEARAAQIQRFVPLAVPLQLLRGFQSLKVFTGTVQRDPRAELAAALRRYDVAYAEAEGGPFLALFVHKDEANAASKVLEGVAFAAVEPPSGDGLPEEELRHVTLRLRDFEEQVARLEAQVARLRERHGAKLLALDALLSRESQKAQAPVRFRTTANSFIVEGWVPASRANELARRLEQATNGKVVVQTYDAPTAHHAPSTHQPPKGEVPMHERIEAVAEHDGGTAMAAPAEPPVKLSNPGAARPFEMMLGLHSYPKYNEFDPTLLVAFVFPLFFGFMVGDVGFGLLVLLVGWYLKNNKPMGIGGPAVGRMLMLAGVGAMLVGVFLFGEAFGLHFTSQHEVSWTSIFRGIDATDHHAMEGLAAHYAMGPIHLGYFSKIHDVVVLLGISVGIALVHLNAGFILGFFNVLRNHGFFHALSEKLAWVILEVGIVLAILPYVGNAGPMMLWAGLGVSILAIVLLVAGHGALAILELPSLATNTLSYTRLTAVGMSKAGLALVFNMVAFEMMGGSPAGWAVWVLGILFILPLAILAGGLHSLRLHFVEFFTKFYEGGGKRYEPFGRRAETSKST